MTANTTNKESIAIEIFEVNYLSPWKLTDSDIDAWARIILEQFPNTTAQRIKEIIDQFKKDDLHWDNQKGVQNILNILKPYKMR